MKLKRDTTVRWAVGVLIIILVLNIVGFSAGQYDSRVFWAVIIIAAFLAYIIIPKLVVPEK